VSSVLEKYTWAQLFSNVMTILEDLGNAFFISFSVAASGRSSTSSDSRLNLAGRHWLILNRAPSFFSPRYVTVNGSSLNFLLVNLMNATSASSSDFSVTITLLCKSLHFTSTASGHNFLMSSTVSPAM